MGFDPCNRALKIWESIWDSNSQKGNSLGSVKVHSLTLFCTHGSTRRDSQASSWPTGLPLGSQPFKPLPWLQAQD
jgi:hypothetical protein